MAEVISGIITIVMIFSILILGYIKHKRDIKKYRDDI